MKERKVGPIRHAPWSRRFKTFYINGSFAHELQVGPVVFQWAHEKMSRSQRGFQFGKLHIWKDMYWR